MSLGKGKVGGRTKIITTNDWRKWPRNGNNKTIKWVKAWEKISEPGGVDRICRTPVTVPFLNRHSPYGSRNLSHTPSCRFIVQSLRDRVYVNIREFFRHDVTKKLLPGKKGINLNLEDWNALMEASTKIDETVQGFTAPYMRNRMITDWRIGCLCRALNVVGR